MKKLNLQKIKKIGLVFVLGLSFLTNIYSIEIKNIQFIFSGDRVIPFKYLPQLFPFSLEHQVELVYFQNWILTESGGNPRAYNRYTRDKGFCQLHDIEYLVNMYWDESLGPFDVWNGSHNLKVALGYLSDLINEFGIEKGFMAYNIGPNRIRQGRILKVGKRYVEKIFGETYELKKENPSFIFCEFPPFVLSFLNDEMLFDDRRKKLIGIIG